MDKRPLIIAITAAVALAYISVASPVDRDAPLYSVLAETLLFLAFVAVFVAAWKFYCSEWNKLSPKSLLRLIYERLLLPIVTIFLVTKQDVTADIVAIVSGVLLLILLMDFGRSIGSYVDKFFSFNSMNSINKRILYTRYPPKNRGDISSMDIIFHLCIFFLIIKKIT